LFIHSRRRQRGFFGAIYIEKQASPWFQPSFDVVRAVDNSVDNKSDWAMFFIVASPDAVGHKPLMKFAAHPAAGSRS
jgi:hypothetical protein